MLDIDLGLGLKAKSFGLNLDAQGDPNLGLAVPGLDLSFGLVPCGLVNISPLLPVSCQSDAL